MAVDTKVVFIVMDIIMGGLLVALGIYRFTISNLGYLRYLLACYYIIYAVILILSDFLDAVRNWFNFLEKLSGKGIYLLYAGILCFDVYENLPFDVDKVSLSFGIIICVYGLFLMIFGFIQKK